MGGGALGPEIYDTFIQAAGGPDALIVVVPTAGGAATYGQDAAGAAPWRAHGARNVVVLHTSQRAVANSDSFPAILSRAGGVWFDGGRQFHLVESYLGTRTEQAFHAVLARGGVVGGSSAGATILGDFLVRGAPSNDNLIMDDPRYEKGFAFLRGVAIDQHVVARGRLADLADSIVPKYPALLPISEDEGTAWVVRGDTATIIGANAAFAYQAAAHDPGKPFLTLRPGDVFDLASRRVVRRAAEGTAIAAAYLDSLFARYADGTRGGAAVLVAVNGAVLADASYGIPAQPKFMPATTLPVFDVGAIAEPFRALCEQLPPPAPPRQSGTEPPPRTAFEACVARSVSPRVGLHRTVATDDGGIRSSVDELYRFARGFERPGTAWAPRAGGDDAGPGAIEPNRGWRADTVRSVVRYAALGDPDGRRAALLRVPARGIVVIVVTGDRDAPAGAIAGGIVDRLLAPFYLGADVSYLDAADRFRGRFPPYQENGRPSDEVTILMRHGWNAFRLRVFVSPVHDAPDNSLANTIPLARRIKQAGALFLLDIHYSDTWADPQHQEIPVAWRALSFDSLEKQVEVYSRETIAALKAAGAMPDWVQVGNEITRGTLWPLGQLVIPGNRQYLPAQPYDSVAQWDHLTRLLKAGIRGVRQGAGDTPPRIAIHIDRGGDWATTKWFFDNIEAAHVDYDIIAQSFYPEWRHGTLEQLWQNMTESARRYHKDILVAETGYGRSHLPDNPDMLWPETPQGRLQFMADLINTVRAANGIGVMYWEPEWEVWNQDGTPGPAVFVLDSLDALRARPASKRPAAVP